MQEVLPIEKKRKERKREEASIPSKGKGTEKQKEVEKS